MYKYKFLSLLQIHFCALFTQNIMLIGKKLWNGRYLRKNDIPFNNKTTPSLLSESPPSLGPTFSIPHPRPTPFHPPPLPQFCHPATLRSRSYLPLLSFCQKYANEIIKIWRITNSLLTINLSFWEKYYPVPCISTDLSGWEGHELLGALPSVQGLIWGDAGGRPPLWAGDGTFQSSPPPQPPPFPHLQGRNNSLF